ncbi:MAG TPA: 2Fe-2S iron-sulfur cluster-binding protein [Acidimicrobiales bacterium]|nr:2Fe-2S iron-sulfur cluster-binding protein [Acidimicrobiales bacterium]
MPVSFSLDGRDVVVADETATLLDALREGLGVRTVKDGCAPQGQCGCCTVWVDGSPRVACVTPVRRVAGRRVTTVEGLDGVVRERFTNAFVATGASQCGFCTPGIVMRLAALDVGATRDEVVRALLAHLCRCTGWKTIEEAFAHSGTAAPRDVALAQRRAALEGHTPQLVGADVVCGYGGFADDSAPAGALVAVPNLDGAWVVAPTLAAARATAGKVQGRRTTMPLRHPLEVPDGAWDLTLRTTWVEPGYLEPDASWCEPGGEPATPLANGGAFGAKLESPAPAVARRLADEHGRAVRVVLAREDVVRLGPKRPPIAAGLRRDGSGVIRVVRTPGIADAIRAVLPEVVIEEVDAPGPPTSAHVRAAGWAEASVLKAALAGDAVVGPARARVDADGAVHVEVDAGDPLDEVVLRSYCIGAAHMALGWVRREGIAVDDSGAVQDLTIRSFGILRAVDTPDIQVTIAPSQASPVAASDAVFAAVAAAAWMAEGVPPEWPTRKVTP